MDAKKVLLLLAVVFVGFWMFSDPSGLADAAKDTASTAWSLLVQVLDALLGFVNAL